MVTRLKHAFERASTLTDSAQEQLADQLMADMDAESKWNATLSNSQELLEQLAEDALRAQRAGNVHEKGFDEL